MTTFFEGCALENNKPVKSVYATDAALTDIAPRNKPVWLRCLRMADIPRRYITENLEKVPGLISTLFPQLQPVERYVIRPLLDFHHAVETERRTIWPLFLRNTVAIPNYRFLYNCSRAARAQVPTEDLIAKKTNVRLRRSCKAQQEIHTVRVLYRDQDPLLAILLSYRHRKNNIYFTDIAEGNLRAFSIEEAKRNLAAQKSIGISQESYLANPDFYYLIEMIDLLRTLCLFRANPDATYWKTTELPTLRCTIFGSLDEPEDIHFVAMPEFSPGVSGRFVITPKEWHGYVTGELVRPYYNNPVLVTDIYGEFTTLYEDYLLPHWHEIRERYHDPISVNHINVQGIDDFLVNTWNFKGGLAEWNRSTLPAQRVECIRKIRRISALREI